MGRCTPDQAGRVLSQHVLVQLHTTGSPSDKLPDIGALCREHRGQCPLLLQITSPEGWITTIKPKARGMTTIDPSHEFLQRLENMVGTDAVFCGGSRGVIPATSV
ncbi:MAG: hypothetical protein AB8I80_13470 [Anaerolineae bacterium]